MSYTKIYLHCVWSTQYRTPSLIHAEHRLLLFNHIQINAKKQDIHIIEIGGHNEHIHCLISLGKKQSIAQIIRLIKGESSYWFNKQGWNLLKWQDDYFAVSIGESQINRVRKYIQNQELHHKRKTFNKEYEEFMSIYKFNPQLPSASVALQLPSASADGPKDEQSNMPPPL